MGTRAAKQCFSTLLDDIASGDHVLICRRSRPIAALIPPHDLDRFRELVRRDEDLAAVLRARGHDVRPWTTAGVIEVIVGYLEASRQPPRPPSRASAIRNSSDERRTPWS